MSKPKTLKNKKKNDPSFRKESIFFFLKFLTFMGVLFFIDLLQPVHQKVIIPFTTLLTKVCVFLLRLLGTATKADGTLIVSPQFVADIKAGCTGIEPIIILLSAIFAYPSSWKSKGVGALIGVFILQGVNIVRIVSLVYLGINHPNYFKSAHAIIWQIIMIALSLFLWILWAKRLTQNEDRFS